MYRFAVRFILGHYPKRSLVTLRGVGPVVMRALYINTYIQSALPQTFHCCLCSKLCHILEER